MDPQQGFRHRFTIEELRRNPRVKGITRIEIKQLERKTQLKVTAVALLCFFLLFGVLGWSGVYVALGTSLAVMSLITYRITQDRHYLYMAAVEIILVILWLIHQFIHL